MSEPREFKNEFPDYTGEIMLDDRNKLLDGLSLKLHKGIKSLLDKHESSIDRESSDNSVYTGNAGYALLHLQLSNTSKDESSRNAHSFKALSWVECSLKKSRVSFLCGDSGPLAIAAVLAHKEGNIKSFQKYVSRLESKCKDVCSRDDLPDELLYGRCGYLASLLFVQKNCGNDSVNKECVILVVTAVVRSGHRLSREQKCQHPLMYEWHEKAYLGAAHGLAGIYYMLLQVKEPTLQEEIHQKVRPCIDFMLTLQYASGNCPSSIGSSSGDKLVHWCHGASGWVHMFALAYKIFKDKRYLQAAKDCGQAVWKRGLLRKGYGLCHGTAGNAYTFLTLFKLTGDQRYVYYAYKFAEWCCDYGKHGCRTPDRPYSLFEGMAGTIYFLSDMLDPSESAFPTFEFN